MARKSGIHDGATPASAVLSVLINQPELDGPKAINTVLRVTRDESLLFYPLQGTPEGELVREVSLGVVFDSESVSDLNLAKDADGRTYLMPEVKPSFSEVSYWTGVPLSTSLLTLSDVAVIDIDKSESTASFADVDPEIWMDAFLRDVETAIAPGSALAESESYQEYLEDLLNSKRSLAEGLSRLVTHVTHDEPAAEMVAMNAFYQAMLRNLYLGRRIDVLAVFKSDATPGKEAYSYVGQISTNKDVEVSAKKIGVDGFLAIPIRVSDITLQKEVELDLTYTLTDWEVRSDSGYFYLSLTDPPESGMHLTVPLPYKRYPDRAELRSHSGEAAWRPAERVLEGKKISSDELFAWNYEVCLTHKTAAQDTVTIEIIPGGIVAGRSQVTLWTALARYMYLREKLLADLKTTAGRFVEMVREVTAALKSHIRKTSVPAQAERFTFELDRVNALINIRESTVRQTPGMALMDADGKCTMLSYDENKNAYILPKDFSDAAVRYKLIFKSYHIANENLTNASVTVSRNASMRAILTDPSFSATPVEHTVRLILEMRPDDTLYAIVLDDAHLVNSGEIIKSLPAVLERLPGTFVTLVLSREPIPESLRRIIPENSQITSEELRFSPDEIRLYFQSLGRFTSPEEAQFAFASTDGLAIGVNAVAMSGHTPLSKGANVFAQYFEDNIWNTWDERTRDFCLKTSVLDEFTPDFARHLILINCKSIDKKE